MDSESSQQLRFTVLVYSERPKIKVPGFMEKKKKKKTTEKKKKKMKKKKKKSRRRRLFMCSCVHEFCYSVVVCAYR